MEVIQNNIRHIFQHRQNFYHLNGDEQNVDGYEIDIRSHPDGLVLNHDRIDFSQNYTLLEEAAKYYGNKKVICNIKESGIEEEVAEILSKNNVDFYFLDSQIPDILRLSKNKDFKGRFIIRISDVEHINIDLLIKSEAKYCWLDWSKFSDLEKIPYLFFINNTVNLIKNLGIEPIIVSPELYTLDNVEIAMSIADCLRSESLSVCTKLPNIWREQC